MDGSVEWVGGTRRGLGAGGSGRGSGLETIACASTASRVYSGERERERAILYAQRCKRERELYTGTAVQMVSLYKTYGVHRAVGATQNKDTHNR